MWFLNRRGGHAARDQPRLDQRPREVQLEVSCPFCGGGSGHAYNVTPRGFYWTCAACARTELIVLPPSASNDAPASMELWRLADRKRVPLVANFVLRPGEGLQLVVQRGRSAIVSELFVDPDGLLNRSREIRQRLLREGCSDI